MAVHHKNIASNLSCEREKENYCPENEDNILESLSNNNYPKNYDKKVITRTGVEIFMRPIKPTDALLLLDMFNNLSPRTRFYRFFSPIKVLPKDLLIKFTQIDYNRDMALIALENNEPNSKILAVARFISRPKKADAEFAVVCRDEWQGRGIGRALLENLILFAKEKQIESMSGYVLAENIHMLSLARSLGFCLSKIPGEDQYFLKIEMGSEKII